MTAIVGWTIIAVVLCSASALLLWPAFRLMRRFHPDSGALRWAFAAATVGCSLALWYLIPLAVHGLFGRVVH
jgi:hypothetical protein